MQIFTVNAALKTSSNLKAHLKKNGHEEAFEAYQKEIEVNPTQSTKRQIDFESSPLNSPSNKQSKLSGASPSVSTAPKYGTNSLLQRSRYFSLLIMLIKCMLPLSLVERLPFRDFLKLFDPSFTCPNRDSLKNYGIAQMKGNLNIIIVKNQN